MLTVPIISTTKMQIPVEIKICLKSANIVSCFCFFVCCNTLPGGILRNIHLFLLEALLSLTYSLSAQVPGVK